VNKLLFEAGVTIFSGAFVFYQQQGSNSDLFRQDLDRPALPSGPTRNESQHSLNINARVKGSYVTGAHAFSVGLQTMQGYRSERDWISANDQQLTLQVLTACPSESWNTHALHAEGRP